MTERPRNLSWQNFRSNILVDGQQRVHRVTDSPFIELFGDGTANRIGIWIEVAPGTGLPPTLLKLRVIQGRTLTKDGHFILEMTTASLHREFYQFALAVIDQIFNDSREPADAVEVELRCFAEFLEMKQLLGIERQLGLLGELLFLERLVARLNVGAIDAWIGPAGEPHDFRVSGREYEIKTTVRPRRIHTINGPEQLVPSTGCHLYVVSFLLGPAGADTGFSLQQKVSELFGVFSSFATRAKFESALKMAGFYEADAQHYSRRFSLRRSAGIVKVDSSFPAITRPMIEHVLGPLASRIESLQFDVNLEGLEHIDGDPEFEAALPAQAVAY